MLVDISNSLRIHNGSAQKNHILSDKHGKRTPIRRSETRGELTDKPNYSHTPIYSKVSQSQFPFYQPMEYQRRSNDNIDFTSCIQFPRNPIKKYSNPILLLNKTPSTAKSLKTSLFGPLGKNGEIDPVNSLFVHLPTESRLKFGYLQIDIDGFGKSVLRDLPSGGSAAGIEELEKVIEDLNINDKPLSPMKKKRVTGLTSLSSSPIKDTSFKPMKKTKVNSKTNYSKWDKSMTISAKAIMKMVDDSLVSSDTEMYNLSQSFMARMDQESSAGISINADDLHDALMEDMEGPISKLKELSI